MGKKIIRTFTIYQVLFTVAGSLTFATYTIFLRAHGLSFFESSIINVFFMLGIMVFEIPTGMIGDYFGRKPSIVISCLLNAIGMIIYCFAGNLSLFIAAEIIIALGRTFSSGSDIAWLKDSLDEISHDHNLEHLLAVMKYKSSFMVIIGGFVGSFIYQSNIAWPFLASGLLYIVALCFVFFSFKETPRLFATPQERNFSAFWKSWQTAGALLKESRTLQLIGILQFSWMFCMMAANMTWGPLINEQLKRPNLVGWFWVLIALAITVGNYISSRYAKNGKSIRNLIRAHLITALPLLGIFLLSPGVLVIILLINEFGRGLSRAAIDAMPNQFIPASIRATTLSAISMFEHLGAVLGLVFFGIISDRLGIQASWFIAGLLMLAALMIYVPLRKKLLVS